jgi:putative transposase
MDTPKTLVRNFNYRLYPTREQRSLLSDQLRVHQKLYNTALGERKAAWKDRQQSVGYNQQSADLIPQMRGHAEVNFSSCQKTLSRLQNAYDAAFSRLKKGEPAGFPRFKNDHRFRSFSYVYGDGAKVVDQKLRIQHVGLVKVKWHRELLGTIKEVRLCHSNDKWSVMFSVEVEAAPYSPSTDEVVGLDPGVSSLFTLSNGEKEGKFISDHRVTEAQKRLSSRKVGSKRRRKACELYSKHKEREANRRKDWHHKTAKALVDKYAGFCVEKTRVKEIMQKGVRGVNRGFGENAVAQFLTILKGKAESAGRLWVEVEAAYTTQACSSCGVLVPKTLSERVHKCPACSFEIDRDVNAALNILSLGKKQGLSLIKRKPRKKKYSSNSKKEDGRGTALTASP